MDSDRAPHYGDYPELFWDAVPDAPVDTDSPVVLARVIERGSMDAIARLVSPAALRRELPRLVVPEHVRRFWGRVLGEMPGGARSS
jgi:hypothetical protein